MPFDEATRRAAERRRAMIESPDNDSPHLLFDGLGQSVKASTARSAQLLSPPPPSLPLRCGVIRRSNLATSVVEVSVIFSFRDQPLLTLEALNTLIRLSNEVHSIEYLLVDIASSKVTPARAVPTTRRP
jgi:hypothetical protein